MHLLVRSEMKSQYVNIENNLLYAALHIYAFNMGIFPEGVIPNLPGEQKNVHMFVFLLLVSHYNTDIIPKVNSLMKFPSMSTPKLRPLYSSITILVLPGEARDTQVSALHCTWLYSFHQYIYFSHSGLSSSHSIVGALLKFHTSLAPTSRLYSSNSKT